jgi:hypothetical protein
MPGCRRSSSRRYGAAQEASPGDSGGYLSAGSGWRQRRHSLPLDRNDSRHKVPGTLRIVSGSSCRDKKPSLPDISHKFVRTEAGRVEFFKGHVLKKNQLLSQFVSRDSKCSLLWHVSCPIESGATPIATVRRQISRRQVVGGQSGGDIHPGSCRGKSPPMSPAWATASSTPSSGSKSSNPLNFCFLERGATMSNFKESSNAE